MSDITLMPIQHGHGCDVCFADSDIALSDSLQTAVLLSLNLDARATDELVLQKSLETRGGWWGNETVGDDEYGSILWTMQREKQTPEALKGMCDMAESRLEWLISDGLATSVHVQPADGLLLINISLSSGDKLNMEALYHAD